MHIITSHDQCSACPLQLCGSLKGTLEGSLAGGHLPPEVFHGAKCVDGAQRLTPGAGFLAALRIVKPQSPPIL